MVVETGKAVGAEGLVAGQVVDIKSEGQAEKVRSGCPRVRCHPAAQWLLSGVHTP